MPLHPCINLRSRQGGQETVIEVRGWPGHSYEGWRAYTPDHVPRFIQSPDDWNPEGVMAKARRKKGRALYACGWHRFKKDHRVAQLLLHVEARAPLRIQQFDSSPGLVGEDRYAVRNFLLSCALDVAKSLEADLGIDSGWLDWRVPERLAGSVAKDSPGFSAVGRRKRARLRGTDVILRRER